MEFMKCSNSHLHKAERLLGDWSEELCERGSANLLGAFKNAATDINVEANKHEEKQLSQQKSFCQTVHANIVNY